jgi:hypothetical protein
MPMPKNCSECHFSTTCSFCEGYDDICVLAPEDAEYEWNFSDGVKPTERPSWCPLKEQPTVDAVPVEWIKNYIKRTENNGNTFAAVQYEMMHWDYLADCERRSDGKEEG